jgi:hypothetical protein
LETYGAGSIPAIRKFGESMKRYFYSTDLEPDTYCLESTWDTADDAMDAAMENGLNPNDYVYIFECDVKLLKKGRYTLVMETPGKKKNKG